jgi:hypothetical protein
MYTISVITFKEINYNYIAEPNLCSSLRVKYRSEVLVGTSFLCHELNSETDI